MLNSVSIDPKGIYDDGAIRQALGVTDAAMAAARRSGSLRFTRQGKRTFYLGEWILDWLKAGSLKGQGCTERAPRAMAVPS
jgi:hypothetical protein